MVSTLVGVPSVAVVPAVVNIPPTGVSTSSGVLLMLSAFPNVSVLSCAGVDVVALVALTTVDIPGIFDVELCCCSSFFFCWRTCC